MGPLISVLIPVYNSEKFLEECICSAINQTYDNLEIVAIDDGSTDKSLEILEKHYDKVKIVSQANQGLAAAVNNGVQNCNGKYIKWISPDDVMYPNCITELAKHSGPDTIVYSNWDIIDENSKLLRTFSESDYNMLDAFGFAVRLLDGQQINVNTTLIPSALLRKHKVRNLEDPVAADYNFFLNVSLTGHAKFFLVATPLIKYRIHSGQLSHKNIAKTLSYTENMKKQYLQKMDDVTRKKYTAALDEYQKDKPLSKQTMHLGLNLLSKMPKEISDSVLVYYLNHIRTRR